MKMDGLYPAALKYGGFPLPRCFSHLPAFYPPATYALRYEGGLLKSWFKWCSAILGPTLAIAYLLPALGADPSRWICSARTIKGNAPFSAISVSSSMERGQEGPFSLHIFITPTGKPEIVLEDVYLSEGKKQRRLDYGIRLERDLCRIVLVTKKKFSITAAQRLTLYFLVNGKRRVVTADLITYLLHL